MPKQRNNEAPNLLTIHRNPFLLFHAPYEVPTSCVRHLQASAFALCPKTKIRTSKRSASLVTAANRRRTFSRIMWADDVPPWVGGKGRAPHLTIAGVIAPRSSVAANQGWGKEYADCLWCVMSYLNCMRRMIICPWEAIRRRRPVSAARERRG